MQVRAAHVHIALAAAHEHQGGAGVNGNAHRRNQHHDIAGDRKRIEQTVYRFEDDAPARRHEDERVRQRRQNRRALQTPGETRARRPSGQREAAPGNQQPRHIRQIVAGISEQRHRIDPQTGRGLDADISKIEHHPDGKGPAEIWRRMAVPMAMMIMTAQRMAVSVAVHGGFMGPAARHRNEKGGPGGPPFQATTGAGEEIRTLDFNLGKVALYP